MAPYLPAKTELGEEQSATSLKVGNGTRCPGLSKNYQEDVKGRNLMVERLLTITDACRFYGLSRPTLMDRIADGLIRVKDLSRTGARYRTLRVIPDLTPDVSAEEIEDRELMKKLGL
jgi:hypothetical protein